jgi:hypothetical protein
MGGLGFLGSGCCSMGRRIGLGELGEELCEWDSLWVDLEQIFPRSPQERVWPKKFRRFLRLARSGGSNECRRKEQKKRSCLEVDQELFHEFAPPIGSICVELEELAQITAERRSLKRLAERKIQVTGRRMPKFLPPVWKPRNTGKKTGDFSVQREGISKASDMIKKLGAAEARGKEMADNNLNFAKDGRNLAVQLVRAPVAEDEGAVEEFYEQLWGCPCEVRGGKGKVAAALVWIKELIDKGSFTEGDCFPSKMVILLDL